MVNDPIADLLVRLRNASHVGHESVVVPPSKMKESIVKLLEREGYVGEVKYKASGSLEVSLRYDAQGRPMIHGAKRVSKPSRRLYTGVHGIHAIKRGHGLLVLSTPKGILTGDEARKAQVGGETLFEIW